MIIEGAKVDTKLKIENGKYILGDPFMTIMKCNG
jgi:hypothetical protein